jgi:hypothetical protein
MSGDNLYEYKGAHWCRHCRVVNSAASRARVKARKRRAVLAAGADADRFAALTGLIRTELDHLTEAERGPYFREPRELTGAEREAGAFARQEVTREQIAELTGLDDTPRYGTIAQRLRQARREHASGSAGPKTMPLPAADGTWQIGRLALWRAAVWPRYSQGNPGRWERTHEDWAPQVTELVERHGRRLTIDQAAESLGIATTGRSQLAWRLLREAGWRLVRPGTPDGTAAPAVLESLRWDGLLTVAQVARAFEVSRGAVWQAVKGGRLTPALRERGGRMLFDPARLAVRKDGRPAPVDAGHPLALGLQAWRFAAPSPRTPDKEPCRALACPDPLDPAHCACGGG